MTDHPWQNDLEPLKGIVSARAMKGETMLLNMGPQHPSTHGVLRLLLELDGEEIVTCNPEIGYLHTGIEKSMESKTYVKAITMTDRMDYLNPPANNLVFVMAIEKLCGLEVPPRAQVIRVILLELMRIASHLVWLGTFGLDLGAMSMFLYTFREREHILHIYEMVSGQRMMGTYFRPGGLWRDVPDGFVPAVRDFLDYFPQKLRDYERLLARNPIWMERTKGIAPITGKQAMAWGLTGPSLRGSGVNFDVRKAMPYSGYEQYDFDIPLGPDPGDVYDRYWCRFQEMWQSLRIVEQALYKLPGGPVTADDRKYTPPPRSEIGVSMEALIHHFKYWTEGIRPPVGEVFTVIEAARGLMSCYLSSDGSPHVHRVHFRQPTFMHISALPHMAPGFMLADIIAILGGIDIVLGDVDR
ncbi:MAG: NADH dehydrogenase (quinone) subunit D [Anaerolineae bacterium]|nr:NADH dehydrogenase (quinone) subunit D [Anaerolineae bacterium]